VSGFELPLVRGKEGAQGCGKFLVRVGIQSIPVLLKKLLVPKLFRCTFKCIWTLRTPLRTQLYFKTMRLDLCMCSTATISSISSRGGTPGQNLLYSPLEEEGASSISSNVT
jgi:hypothetical protein